MIEQHAGDDESFVRQQYAEALSGTTSFDFLQSLRDGARRCCRQLVIGHHEGARYVFEAVVNALRSRQSFSMVRIGDGEGNVLGLALYESESELRWFNAVFHLQDSQILGREAAKDFATAFAQSVLNADAVGFTGFNVDPEEFRDPEQAQRRIQESIKADPRVAIGILRALQFGKSAIENHSLRHAVMTNAWIYVGLIERLHALFEAAPRVLVISGRQELERVFTQRLKGKLAAFMSIPLQASDCAPAARPSHYPERYGEIISALQSDLRGTLVLVGAGIFGKIYCDAAKRSGGVALDLGSAFDMLAGRRTRPVHSNPEIVGHGFLPWLP